MHRSEFNNKISFFSSFHPVLNKNLNKIITTIINIIKCGHSSNKINVERQTVINLQQNVAASKEQDLHFEMLKLSWM